MVLGRTTIKKTVMVDTLENTLTFQRLHIRAAKVIEILKCSSDGEPEIGNFTDSDDGDDDAWDAPNPLDPNSISPDVSENVDDLPESSVPVEKGIVDSPASPDPESPESPAAVEKPTVDSPATSPDPESPESPAPEDSDSMEMDPPDSTISEVAPVIPANVETAPPNSADDTEPFVRVGEAACPPADDDDDMEPVRIFVPEEWE
ncbi:vegetative cell wall protein gp1-like, partial [Fopius arisanus]|uniref:Vegetative cell wall protein gp1-like n=1 Tax=Fopius arisanus TaxID=64838 RepID=A0A9R1SZ13_9HYME